MAAHTASDTDHPENALNFLISSFHSKRSQPENWHDLWDPEAILRESGFGALLHAESVKGVGRNDDQRPEDILVCIELCPGEDYIPIPDGLNKLQRCRTWVYDVLAECGNMHWATEKDVVALAEALGIGFILLSNEEQEERGSHVKGLAASRSDYEWWVLLYLVEGQHFTLAFWSHDNSSLTGSFFHITEIPSALREAYNNANRNCHEERSRKDLT